MPRALEGYFFVGTSFSKVTSICRRVNAARFVLRLPPYGQTIVRRRLSPAPLSCSWLRLSVVFDTSPPFSAGDRMPLLDPPVALCWISPFRPSISSSPRFAMDIFHALSRRTSDPFCVSDPRSFAPKRSLDSVPSQDPVTSSVINLTASPTKLSCAPDERSRTLIDFFNPRGLFPIRPAQRRMESVFLNHNQACIAYFFLCLKVLRNSFLLP